MVYLPPAMIQQDTVVTPATLTEWGFFAGIVVVSLVLDLFLFHRKEKKESIGAAIGWSVFWIALAAGFNVWVYYDRGHQPAVEFLTAYLVEKSLSVDNLFVFSALFTYFAIPATRQHRLLFWGVIGAVGMRAIMIFAGVELIERFHWILFVFGALLLYTGWRIAFGKDQVSDPEDNPVIRLFRKFFHVHPGIETGEFLVRQGGKWMATPLLIALVAVESTDVMFAIDSVPAVLILSKDPYIIYTSNIFAILGLRALYFVLRSSMDRFRHLKYGVGFLLVFVGLKMVVEPWIEITPTVSLGVIAGVLLVSVITSLRAPLPSMARGETTAHAPHDFEED